MIFNIAKSIVCKMPLTKLDLMNSDLRPYLTALLMVVLCKVEDVIHIPKKKSMIKLVKKKLENFLVNKKAKSTLTIAL